MCRRYVVHLVLEVMSAGTYKYFTKLVTCVSYDVSSISSSYPALSLKHPHNNKSEVLDQNNLCVKVQGRTLHPIQTSPPQAHIELSKIIMLSVGGGKRSIHGGPWSLDNIVLTQYYWRGGALLLNTSTALLRSLQNQVRSKDHPALKKWETSLAI